MELAGDRRRSSLCEYRLYECDGRECSAGARTGIEVVKCKRQNLSPFRFEPRRSTGLVWKNFSLRNSAPAIDTWLSSE